MTGSEIFILKRSNTKTQQQAESFNQTSTEQDYFKIKYTVPDPIKWPS